MKKLDFILLIDDDEPTNYLTQRLIKKMGITERVLAIDDAREALVFLKQIQENEEQCPDMIFLDINMPGMNGWEFLDQYTELSPVCKAEVVIIMITTSLNPEDAEKAKLYQEINAFRNKPLHRQMINELIEEYFD